MPLVWPERFPTDVSAAMRVSWNSRSASSIPVERPMLPITSRLLGCGPAPGRRRRGARGRSSSAGRARARVKPPEGAAPADEVVVTARRRTENVQDVPIAISVLSGKTLDAQGTYNIGRLTQLQPTLQFYSQNPRNTFINIRGIGGLIYRGLQQQDIATVVGVVRDPPWKMSTIPTKATTAATPSASPGWLDLALPVVVRSFEVMTSRSMLSMSWATSSTRCSSAVARSGMRTITAGLVASSGRCGMPLDAG